MWTDFIPLYTLTKKECTRVLRTWIQTLLPPVVTTTLYYLIFGHIIASKLSSDFSSIPYGVFIIPGLTALGVISAAYANVSSSFFIEKFQRSMESLLSSPLSATELIMGFVLGGIFRGVLTGCIITFIGYVFSGSFVQHFGLYLLMLVLTSAFFGLCGLINSLFAKKFDQINFIPTFILTPLTYLGGVFYPLTLLPQPWDHIAHLNPIAWIVAGLHFAILDHHTVSMPHLILGLSIGTLLLFIFAKKRVQKRMGVRI